MLQLSEKRQLGLLPSRFGVRLRFVFLTRLSTAIVLLLTALSIFTQ